jgi:transcriptional regulator with XRE-family HTH domain
MSRLLGAVILAVCLWASVAGVLAGSRTGAGGPEERGARSFSAAVAPASSGAAAGAAASANWGNRSAAASADPSRWGEGAGSQDAARHSRRRTIRRLARLVVASSAERLGVPRGELAAAVRTVARREPGVRRPRVAGLPALRDPLAAALARELGTSRERVLAAARAELDARLTYGAGIGLVSPAGRALVLACFDRPAACDARALRRVLRFAHLLGR